MLGAAAGILFGVSDVAIKALTGLVGDDGMIGARLSPWTLVARRRLGRRLLRLGPRPAGRRGRRRSSRSPATAANVSGILGGILVFGDPLPGDAFGIVCRPSPSCS